MNPSIPPDSGPLSPETIELHIDTLVVEGVELHRADQLSASVQKELQALISKQGLGLLAAESRTTSHRQIKNLLSPQVRLPRISHATDAGAKIARAIHGGLKA